MKNQLNKIINPNLSCGPEVRWWMAEGYHTDETLEKSVQELHDLGFSGCELLTLTEYSIDRQLYGWGSEEYTHDLTVIAKKATELGLGFSITSGPNYQPAVPDLDINDEACAQELDFTNVNVKAGESFKGELKPYQHLEMIDMDAIWSTTNARGANTQRKFTADEIKHIHVRTLAVKLANPDDIEKVDLNKKRILYPVFFGPTEEDIYETIYFVKDSVIDLTESVTTEDGKLYLEWTAPEDGNYVVLTFWRHSTGHTVDSSIETAFVISHIDKRGPEAQKKYWNEHIFTPELREIILQNGNVDFFQDSLEIRTLMSAALWWSEDFLDEFEKRRGYSLIPYLPIIIHYNNHSNKGFKNREEEIPRFDYINCPGLYVKVMDDLHLTQTDLYREYYLQPVKEWLNGLGIKLRAQAAYGSRWVAFDMSLPADSVDIQETETLEMCDIIDYYRTFSGGVHMYRKPVYSSETGAIGGGAYGTSLKKYMWMIHRLFAGGVNRVITHGYSTVSGPEATTMWPGYDGIGFLFSERWGARHPYKNMMSDFSAYIARMQTALRTGSAKVDVGILNQMFTSPESGLYQPPQDMMKLYFWKDVNLALAGYTYDFFAPQYLEQGFKCENGLFDAGNTDYKALVVYQPYIPVNSAKELLKYAKAGMPVVIVGSAGTEAFGLNENPEEVIAIFDELKKLPNVACCATPMDTAETLKAMGIMPRVSPADPVGFYSVIREAEDEKYMFIMNSTDVDQETVITVEGEYAPEAIDCWNGKLSKVGIYEAADGKTSWKVSLKAGDAALYTLLPENGKVHAVSTDGCLAVEEEDLLAAASEKSGRYTVSLSDGTEKTVEITVPEIKQIKNWQIVVDDWKMGEKKTITETRCGHTTTEYYYETAIDKIHTELTELKPWKDIPEIGKDVSGVGHYSASFELPADWSENNGLIADLGSLYEMARVSVNGQTVQCANMMNPKVDISEYVKAGSNEIEIEVSTTLLNRLIEMGRYTAGQATMFGMAPVDYHDYGLTDCKLVPYTKAELM